MTDLDDALRETAYSLIGALSKNSDIIYPAINGMPMDGEKFTEAAAEILDLCKNTIFEIQKGLGVWSDEPEEKLSDFDSQQGQAEFVIYRFFMAITTIKLCCSDGLSAEIENAVTLHQKNTEC